MPTVLKHSIDAYTDGDFLDEIKIDKSIEVSKRRGTDGTFKKVKTFNPTNAFSIKGGGASGIALGVADLTIAGLADGVIVVDKDSGTQKNNDFDDFDASGEHLPGASELA